MAALGPGVKRLISCEPTLIPSKAAASTSLLITALLVLKLIARNLPFCSYQCHPDLALTRHLEYCVFLFCMSCGLLTEVVGTYLLEKACSQLLGREVFRVIILFLKNGFGGGLDFETGPDF